MKIPRLKPPGRDREYLKYNYSQRCNVLIGWLFKNENHREMDIKLLNLTHESNGFQSFGILNYLGLKKDFKGLFKDYTLNESISFLEKDNQDFSLIIKLLNYSRKINKAQDQSISSTPNQKPQIVENTLPNLKEVTRLKNIEDLKKEKAGIQALKKKFSRFKVAKKSDIEIICKILGVNPKRYFKTFDGVILREGLNKIQEINTLEDFIMVELKATRGAIKDFPNNSFFGFTQNEHDFLKIFYRNYFLCIYHVDKKLCSDLIDIFEFEKLTRTSENRSLLRTQYQVKFKSYDE